MKVLVCSQQRTGSNMLRTMLAQQPTLNVGGEVCNSQAREWWPDWKTNAPVPTTLPWQTLLKQPVEHIVEAWKAFDVWNLHDRWQWNPNWYNEKRLDTRWHDALLQDPTFQVIWLEREDKIAQSMSFVLAETTSNWIKYKDDDNTASPRFSLNAQEVGKFVEKFGAYRALIKRKFAPYSLPSISVTYEDLCEEPHETMMRIMEFLGIPVYQPCQPDTKRTYTTPLRTMVTNYDEIVAYINGT